MSTVELKDVGPIESLTIQVPPAGGIVTLRGLNDIGKSESLKAISALAQPGTPLTVRDGALRGEVTGFGVKLTVGRSTRRTGELEVIAIESKYDVSELIDPKLKSPEAADAKRIKALCALVGAKPDISLFRPLLKNQVVFDKEITESAIKADDVVTMAERVKRDLEAAARRAEDAAAKAEGRATAHNGAAEGVNLEAPSDAAALDAAVEKAVRRQAELETRAKAHAEGIERRQATEVRLTALESPGQTVEEIEAECTAINAAVQAANKAELVAREALQAAEKHAELTRQAAKAAEQRLKDAEAAEALRLKYRVALSAAVPPAVSIEEHEAAARDLSAARAAAETGVLVRKAHDELAKAVEAIAEASAEHVKAKALREAAKGTDEVLSALVGKLGTPLRVEAGRLVLNTPKRGATYFGELSDGKRATIAIDIGLEALGEEAKDKRAILTLSQHIYEGIDGKNRREIAAHAKRRNVLIFTAEASEDEQVTAEVFNG